MTHADWQPGRAGRQVTTPPAGAGRATDAAPGGNAARPPRFRRGQRVVVARRFPPGHLRTPYYCRGKTGVVERVLPAFLNPEEEGYGLYDRPPVTLYRVRFRQADLWPRYVGPAHDTVDIEIYEHWLEPVGSQDERAEVTR